MRIASANQHDVPRFLANDLSTPEDRQVAADTLRLTRRIAAMPALAKYTPTAVKPRVQCHSDDDLARLAGVVGTQLRLRGAPGLRIADASVMPTITSGNSNAPTLMSAERAPERFAAGKS